MKSLIMTLLICLSCQACMHAQIFQGYTTEESVKLTLSADRDQPSDLTDLEILKRLQKERGISDKQIYDLLVPYIYKGMNEQKIRIVQWLAIRALSALPHFTTKNDKPTMDLVLSIFNDPKSELRKEVFGAYMLLTDHEIVGLTKDILDNPGKFKSKQPSYNYESFVKNELIYACGNAIKENNDDKKHRLINVLKGFIGKWPGR